MPNSHSFDEFSERPQIVLFTLRDPELNAVYSGNADVRHVPRELEVMPRKWESLNAKAELARNASRRTLSRGSDVVRSPPFGVGKDSHEMVGSSCCSTHAVKELPQNRRVRLRQQRHRSCAERRRPKYRPYEKGTTRTPGWHPEEAAS